jgi:hypothetical protein
LKWSDTYVDPSRHASRDARLLFDSNLLGLTRARQLAQRQVIFAREAHAQPSGLEPRTHALREVQTEAVLT